MTARYFVLTKNLDVYFRVHRTGSLDDLLERRSGISDEQHLISRFLLRQLVTFCKMYISFIGYFCQQVFLTRWKLPSAIKSMVVTTLDDIISQSEAARLRGVSREAIRNLIDRGRLRGVTVGGRLCVYRSEVLSFEPEKGGRPSKQATVTPPNTKSEIRRADKTAQKLNQAFRKAAEDGQQAGKKKGGKK